ncbi:MAG: hypothetical protein O7E49_01745, partial [Gemmatimonadetes bacterium]|nr:hypothetical protein [Gemmatimonadota bacterium]
MYHKHTKPAGVGKGPWKAPTEWRFNDADRNQYAESFYKLPCRLVRDGAWAKLVTDGGPAVPLVLTALASHVWIGKRWTCAGVSLRRLA